MRNTISRAELHQRFSAALAAHPASSTGTFVFEIDVKEPDGDGCNWYPLAAIHHWTGDLKLNLAAFRAVREELCREFNVEESVGAALSS
jgi:hypothetical protein